jgi:hypothetical protein
MNEVSIEGSASGAETAGFVVAIKEPCRSILTTEAQRSQRRGIKGFHSVFWAPVW